MKKYFCDQIIHLFCVILYLVFNMKVSQASYNVYVSCSKDKLIKVYDFDSNLENNKLKEIQNLDLAYKPGSIVFTKNKEYAYIAAGANRKEKAKIICVRRRDDGKLEINNIFNIDTKAAFLSLSKDEKYILSAHYNTGDIFCHSLNYENEQVVMKLIQVLRTDKKAHCVSFHPSGDYFYVPHTGEYNKIDQFIFDKSTGHFKYFANKYSPAPINTGPRHLWFSPNGEFSYSSNEQGNSIGTWKVNQLNANLTFINSVPTFNDKNFSARNTCSDIELTSNGKFAYVANRGHNSLAVFKINQVGEISFLQNHKTANTPRSFNISDDNKWLLVAGQKDNKLILYTINHNNGMLTEKESYQTGNFPSWVVFVNSTNKSSKSIKPNN